MTFVDIPELNWAIPESPTIREPKAVGMQPDFVVWNFYFTEIAWDPATRTVARLGPSRPAPTVGSDNDVRPAWRYETLDYKKRCRTKKTLWYGGYFVSLIVLCVRFYLLAITIIRVVRSLAPIPGLIGQAWRLLGDVRRPVQWVVTRRQPEYR
ncbi:uncharacterized protein C8Q71DRAFT_504042 [Rhodofomes roseus]|uniref:Uncharacterized protein n=1 Tax=Rhodofomes roseus TaxID=34475 RepID=A0ABQ8KMA4_9APHY|nr:uncharacterized protein C8Q71DRAFT_504042 [Rhodofomes roseus]KAH9839244.1 hypothetical protein C8Q71DRAFT_504042 [Rhodofomes roseus]